MGLNWNQNFETLAVSFEKNWVAVNIFLKFFLGMLKLDDFNAYDREPAPKNGFAPGQLSFDRRRGAIGGYLLAF